MTKLTDLPRIELDARDALIISLHYGMRPPASDEFIGERLGVSPEYVRHLRRKLMHRMRVFAGKAYPVKWEDIR